MRVPRTNWHDEVLDSQILENLDSAIPHWETELIEVTNGLVDAFPGASPEHVAKHIGSMVVDEADTDDLTTPVKQDTNGREGEKMALGYIGVKGFELADIGEDE